MKKKVEVPQLTAVGVTSGIGSMLHGAAKAGFKTLGNIEWRKYYHARDERGRNTFTENFPGAVFKHKWSDLTPEEVERLMNPTLALMHCECGNFSKLNGANADRLEDLTDPGDIPITFEVVAKLQPRFFAADNLAPSFQAFSMRDYVDALPDYDIFPEAVSNWGYGNVQKKRDRMFVLGAKKEEGFTFRPDEHAHSGTVRSVLEGLGEPGKSNYPNHDPHALDVISPRSTNILRLGKSENWRVVRDWFAARPPGTIMEYLNKDGELKKRIGFLKAKWDGPCNVLTGGNATIHPIRNVPFTIRERARIQGFDDDFVFYGTKLDEKGQWVHENNMHMVKMTGKAMPIQFNEYFARQVAAHVLRQPFKAAGTRLLKNDPFIDEAKTWFCDNVGYSKQEAACGACWLAEECEVRRRRFGYTPPPEAAVRKVPKAPAVKAEKVPNAPKAPKAPRAVKAPKETIAPAGATATTMLKFD